MGLQSHFRSANYKLQCRLLLIISGKKKKTDPRNDSKKEKRSYDKFRNNKTMLKIFSFVQVLYLKEQSNILRCLCSLKFEKKVYSVISCSLRVHVSPFRELKGLEMYYTMNCHTIR